MFNRNYYSDMHKKVTAEEAFNALLETVSNNIGTRVSIALEQCMLYGIGIIHHNKDDGVVRAVPSTEIIEAPAGDEYTILRLRGDYMPVVQAIENAKKMALEGIS